MLLFCDESGDPGLPMASGSSDYFAVGILSCQDGNIAAHLAEAQEKVRRGLRWKGEFKWSKMPVDVRTDYMLGMAPLLLPHRVVIWDKLRGGLHFRDGPEFEVMRRCKDAFRLAEPVTRIVVDGERDSRRSSAIRLALGAKEVRMERSHSCPQLQMADMLVGFHVYMWRKGLGKIPKELHHLEVNRRWCS
jgi:hypothetical protein